VSERKIKYFQNIKTGTIHAVRKANSKAKAALKKSEALV